MKKIKKNISNPMTIVAIFAAVSETSAAVSLPFLDNDEREIYVWFLISFPFYLLFLFFVTLNFNYRSLYAPSDFDSDKYFVKVIEHAKDHPRADFSARVRRFRRWPWSAQAPPAQIDLQTGIRAQHSIYLPGSLNGLSIIDTRGMNTQAEFDMLMEKLRKPGKVVVFLACNESVKLLKDSVLRSSRHKKKDACDVFWIVFNLDSQDVTVLDQTLED
ncbi:hypothetical protein [Pseudomonas frederiksbergensis]|uniref:Uncharacterized protein n=1 Tax=Pseudomonas frederiksbergensis TaxID=104087 RepID=A0A423K5C8_9PSED|nr:hypothetical protein [Pseudomonas frederiksbergensis]RON46719.1 hypothetical protein BK665_29115 [Pseudomonas frederiksbergensis]